MIVALNKILEIKFGSHLYGTDTENSDLDLKAIYLPTAKEICLGNYKRTITTVRPKQPFERNKKDDVDIEIFSLDRYLELLVEGQTLALDMLFADVQNYTYSNHKYIQLMWEIYDNRHEILNKNVNSFIGYARTQAAKYGVKGFRVAALREVLEFLKSMDDYKKLNEYSVAVENFVVSLNNEHVKFVDCKAPNGKMEKHLEVCNKKYPLHATVKYLVQQLQRKFDEYGQRALAAEKNEGIDFKSLSHAVRVNSEAIELLTTGFITFPRPDKELLLDIKLGKMKYKEIEAIIEKGLDDLVVAQQKSTLREAPNQEWVDNFIYEVYSNIVKNAL